MLSSPQKLPEEADKRSATLPLASDSHTKHFDSQCYQEGWVLGAIWSLFTKEPVYKPFLLLEMFHLCECNKTTRFPLEAFIYSVAA